MKAKTLISIVIIILFGLIFYYVAGRVDIGGDEVVSDQSPDTSVGENSGDLSNMIVVSSIKEGDTIDATNGFTVTGKAVGNWYFEATAPMYIYANDGTPLGGNYMRAQGEWMTESFVDFKGEIPPFLTHGAKKGYVLFENSNPSEDEGSRHILRINVQFPVQETQKIKIYLGNSIKNPNMENCSLVYAVSREVPKAASIATLAINTLLYGPVSNEADLAYTSAFGSGAYNGSLKSISIKNGVATADFSRLPSGGSCLVAMARAQIEKTLEQFPTVFSVKITLNGSESEALQP